jgi:hypothetical protein
MCSLSRRILGKNVSIHKAGHSYHSKYIKDLEKQTLRMLAMSGVNTSKVRCAFTPAFVYDVTADVVNPDRLLCIPTERSGLFKAGGVAEDLSPNKGNIMEMRTVSTYQNLSVLKLNQMIAAAPKGIAVYVNFEKPNIIYDTHQRLFTEIRFIEL